MAEQSPTTGGAPLSGQISDDDISALLNEGRRTLPSQRKVETVSPDLPLVTEVEAAGAQLANVVGSARSTYKQMKNQSAAVQIGFGVEYARSLAEGMTRFIQGMHNLPPDSPQRHRAVGELLLPFAVSHWREFPPTDGGSLIMEYHSRENPPTEDGQTSGGGSPWVKSILPYFNLVQTGSHLPDVEQFAEASATFKPRLKEIKTKVSELERRLESARGKLTDAEPDEYDAASAAVSRFERELVTEQQRIPQLFEQIRDVRLANVPEVFSSLAIRMAPKDEICKNLCAAVDSFERLAQFAALSIGKQVKGSMSLFIPLPTPEGKVALHKISVGPDEIRGIVANTEQFSEIVLALKALRDLISTVHRATGETLDLSSAEAPTMKKALHVPLIHAELHDAALRKLIGHSDSKLSFAAIQLLQTPVYETIESDTPYPVLELPGSFGFLSLVTEQYLCADEQQGARLRAVFEAQPRYAEALGVLSRARDLIRERKIVDLSIFIDDQLVALRESRDQFCIMGVLAVLHGLTRKDELVRELRFQMPNLPITKELGKLLIQESPGIQNLILDSVHDIVCTFSQSLRDYYAAEDEGRLKQIVDEYRFYLRNPEILAGIPVNHALKNSIAVYGPPGVGKSFFAQCLANELDDITLMVLSTADKKPEEDQLAYIKSVFDKAKNSKSPVLLLIDEAETTVFYRMHPLASAGERERTNYILQAVDEIRKSHGNIFLLIASNYPDRVDDAMERHGRVDLVVYLEKPGPEERESIIRDTLKKENIPLHPSIEEIDELVRLTDQFIPIQIIQAIIGTHRLYIPTMRLKGESIEWSVELLKDQLKLMAKEDETRREKRRVMTRSVPAESASAPDLNGPRDAASH